MLKYLIGVVIAAYVIYLVYRQVKNFKNKNYCATCSGCPSASSCGQFKDDTQSYDRSANKN